MHSEVGSRLQSANRAAPMEIQPRREAEAQASNPPVAAQSAWFVPNPRRTVHVGDMTYIDKPTFTTSIETRAAEDHRDTPGGKATGFSINFALHGPAATIAWAINTRWFLRPVITATLSTTGSQQRSSHPGPDPHYKSLTAPGAGEILVIDRDGLNECRSIDAQANYLLDALVGQRHEEVFLRLLDIYREQFRERQRAAGRGVVAPPAFLSPLHAMHVLVQSPARSEIHAAISSSRYITRLPT